MYIQWWKKNVNLFTNRAQGLKVVVVYLPTSGQYSPLQLELAGLESSVLYGAWFYFQLKCNSGHLNSKGFYRKMFWWCEQLGQNKLPWVW